MGKITGYYVEHVSITLGTGATSRKSRGENIFLARELADRQVEISLLNMNGEPTNIKEIIPVEEFHQRCQPCPEYVPPPQRRLQEQQEARQRADRMASRGNLHMKRKEFNSAEFEFGQALRLDEENVRANYGMGKLKLALGEVEEAKEIFRRLTSIEALFEEENKHVFNEFGIDLRQQKMYDEAIANYRKALEISQRDPVLYFNLARALVGKELHVEALAALQQAMEIKGEFPEARKLEHYIRNRMKNKD
ncbi:MAG: tetratricopeptide repeat protein [Deltaproteobacteria bacterium]|nr:tetratricopeptide repeat protein [Candidatus Anaeroferrophillacea bacterium]